MQNNLENLLTQIQVCRICEDALPCGPRPVLQIGRNSQLLIAGQAPGSKVHKTGIPFDDPSGKRLREWIGISEDQFYDADITAILPMGFCYPGKGKTGDLPPRPECAANWREKLLQQANNIQMTLVLGQYAQSYHFPEFTGSLAELVKSWRDYWPTLVPLPHPSPRNNRWLKQNPWFETDLIPQLQQRIQTILK